MALTNLGLALQEVRRLEEAITAHQDAATLFRETGDRHREIIALENLGESTISGFKVRRPASTGVRQHPPSQVTGTGGLFSWLHRSAGLLRLRWFRGMLPVGGGSPCA